MKNAVIRYDAFVATHIAKLPQQWYGFFKHLGFFVRPGAWIGLALLLASWAFFTSQYTAALTYLLLAACIPLSTIIKFFFKRDRPVTVYSQNMRIKSYSFPSSHSYAAAVGTATVAYAVANVSQLFIPALLLLIVLALTVAVSRVYVGAHYPSDVTGGLLLGIAVSLLLIGAANV